MNVTHNESIYELKWNAAYVEIEICTLNVNNKDVMCQRLPKLCEIISERIPSQCFTSAGDFCSIHLTVAQFPRFFHYKYVIHI